MLVHAPKLRLAKRKAGLIGGGFSIQVYYDIGMVTSKEKAYSTLHAAMAGIQNRALIMCNNSDVLSKASGR